MSGVVAGSLASNTGGGEHPVGGDEGRGSPSRRAHEFGGARGIEQSCGLHRVARGAHGLRPSAAGSYSDWQRSDRIDLQTHHQAPPVRALRALAPSRRPACLHSALPAPERRHVARPMAQTLPKQSWHRLPMTSINGHTQIKRVQNESSTSITSIMSKAKSGSQWLTADHSVFNAFNK